MTAPPLEAQSLHRFYHSGDEETQALRGVSVEIRPGEFVAVVGPSGSGKSTLLACLTGLDEPDGGTVRIAGTRITRRPDIERARLRSQLIGIVTQRGNLFDHLTVSQNIQLTRRLGRRPATRPVDDLLSELGIAHRAHARPQTLSGGESVRAGLAVALANEPEILVADEPTGELDSATERQILALLAQRARAGLSLLIASHSHAVSATADRVLTMADGELR